MRRSIYILFFIIFFIAATGYYLPRYLYKEHTVDAEILIIEGWLSEGALKKAADIYNSGNYKTLIISGILMPDAVNMHSFGKLVFNLKDHPEINAGKKLNPVVVNAFGQKVDGEYPHFRLFVNDSLTGSTYVSKKSKEYRFFTGSNIKNIDNIKIDYDNDGYTYWRDRNLYVNYVKAGGILIPSRSDLVYYDMHRPGDYRQLEPHFRSYAGYSAFILENLGFADSIITVTAYNTKISRTYSCASYFREWYLESPYRGKPFNIVSVGHHTRRTWMIYNRLLGNDTDLGIILIDNDGYNKDNWWKSLAGISDTVHEMYSYIYNIITLPFQKRGSRQQD
jgi:hypothetical protein